jgi:hypothetical protein
MSKEAETVSQTEEQVRDFFPFTRPKIGLKHLIPILGVKIYGDELKEFKLRVPPTDWNQGDKKTTYGTLFVNTWPTPQNSKERREHMKTQLIHGILPVYHAVMSAGITYGALLELHNLISK